VTQSDHGGEAGAGEEYVVLTEGRTRIIAPNPRLYQRPDGVYEPAWAPVFYNPRMAHNRDIAVIFANVYGRLRGVKELTVVEPLAGSGVRAARYALETGAWVVANDIDPAAARLIVENVKLNNISARVQVLNIDANELLASLRRRGITPTIVDLDPFGSPAPFIDAAIRSIRVRGVLAVTATDTAPLCGSHPRALRRRYDVHPGRMLWEKEQAVRVLAGYIIRRAASHEYGARVLLAYYKDYYVRLYVELVKGAGKADASLESLGSGVSCSNCGFGDLSAESYMTCPYCGGRLQVLKPIYTGPLCDPAMLSELVREAEARRDELASGEEVATFLKGLVAECSIVKPYIRIDKLCSFIGMSMPSPSRVVEALREAGYRAARTHFDPRSVKTEAPFHVLVETVRRLSPSAKP